jgi:hypothetical protein
MKIKTKKSRKLILKPVGPLQIQQIILEEWKAATKALRHKSFMVRVREDEVAALLRMLRKTRPCAPARSDDKDVAVLMKVAAMLCRGWLTGKY